MKGHHENHGRHDPHAGHAHHDAHNVPAPHAAPAREVSRAMPHGTQADHTHASHAGHDRHAGHSVAMFRDKFWLSLLLTIPTVLWGHMLQGALGWSAPHFRGSHWIPAVFGTAVFAYGGWPFLAEIGRASGRDSV